jgi:transposase-like protein
VEYLNNIIQADNRFIRRKVRFKQWLQFFSTARHTIAGYEAMHMIIKEQVRHVAANDAIACK